MTFKELFKREMHVVVHGQSGLFRVIKYIIILIIGASFYLWQGLVNTGILFLVLAVLSIATHFLFRWKTKGWTQSWWLYKKALLD